MPHDRRAEIRRHRILPDDGLHRIARRELQHDEDQDDDRNHHRNRLQDADERVASMHP